RPCGRARRRGTVNHMDDILLKHGIELPADYQPGARIAVKNANPAHRFTCLTPSARTKDANGRVVYRAKASAYGVVDRHDEVIDRGAFAAYAKENPEVVLLWGHMHHQYPVGVITRGYET